MTHLETTGTAFTRSTETVERSTVEQGVPRPKSGGQVQNGAYSNYENARALWKDVP